MGQEYDIEEAAEFVFSRLPEKLKGKLTVEEVDTILEWDVRFRMRTDEQIDELFGKERNNFETELRYIQQEFYIDYEKLLELSDIEVILELDGEYEGSLED
jgi:hypothetical protein